MDKAYIDRHLVVDRYVSGNLTPAELDDFEERLAWDQELIDEVDLAEGLRDGMRSVEHAGSSVDSAAAASPRRLPLALAASFLSGILVTGIVMNQSATDASLDTLHTNVISLDTLRSFGSQVVVASPGTYLVLMVPADASGGLFDAEISVQGRQEPVWSQQRIGTGFAQSLAIGLPADLLPPGYYMLHISGHGDDADSAVRDIPFQVVAEQTGDEVR